MTGVCSLMMALRLWPLSHSGNIAGSEERSDMFKRITRVLGK